MRADITFASEGVTCRGWLYLPGAPCFADAAGAAVDWFTRYLRG